MQERRLEIPKKLFGSVDVGASGSEKLRQKSALKQIIYLLVHWQKLGCLLQSDIVSK